LCAEIATIKESNCGRRSIVRSDIRSFKDLDAWKVSIELVLIAYELAKRLPLTERFELSAQIRRAAVSVPSIVAEGQAVGKSLRFLYHVRIALGSLGELETDFEIARRLGMLSSEDLAELNEHIARSGQLLHGPRSLSSMANSDAGNALFSRSLSSSDRVLALGQAGLVT
jgi:four helix bundle protein